MNKEKKVKVKEKEEEVEKKEEKRRVGRPKKEEKKELDSLGRKKRERLTKKGKSIEETRREKKKLKEVKRHNEIINEEEMEIDIFKIWQEELPGKMKELKKEIEEIIKKTIEKGENIREINGKKKESKYNTSELRYYLTKPKIPITIRARRKKYSYEDIALFCETYWECVYRINIRGILYTPSIPELCSLMNLTEHTLESYCRENEDIEELIQILLANMKSFITSNGLEKNIDTIFGIFILKSAYGMRDNDQQQQTITNNTMIITDDLYADLMAKHGKQINMGENENVD